MFIYFWQRERKTEHERGRGRERRRETQNSKQAPGSELPAERPKRGSSSQTARSWTKPKSDAQLTEPPRCPHHCMIWRHTAYVKLLWYISVLSKIANVAIFIILHNYGILLSILIILYIWRLWLIYYLLQVCTLSHLNHHHLIYFRWTVLQFGEGTYILIVKIKLWFVSIFILEAYW